MKSVWNMISISHIQFGWVGIKDHSSVRFEVEKLLGKYSPDQSTQLNTISLTVEAMFSTS